MMRRVLLAVGLLAALPSAASARVLTVGVSGSHIGTYRTIQSAVDAAVPGDWVLVGPGDYKEKADYGGNLPGDGKAGAGVWISKPGIHLRGMDRNGVIVDGTKSGPACSSAKADQDGVGPLLNGRNGVEVYKADGDSVENLTACNFLGSGNEIWFNGGDGSGHVGVGSFHRKYLNATTTYYDQSGTAPAGTYGIFVSNGGDASGASSIEHTYASNMNDSAYYIGACPDCNMVLSDAHGQYSALGYSGTNSGGRLVITGSEFDLNQDGFDTNSMNNDDAPSPQDGTCPASVNGGVNVSPPPNTQRSHSCWVFTHNYVHDNNNPNVPAQGAAAAGPVGTGMSVAGGRHNIITDNVFANNNAWGLILVPYPDTENPPAVNNCQGGIGTVAGHPASTGPVGAGTVCYFDDWGNEVANNTFINNGSWNNPSNGDVAELSLPHTDGNCWHGNTAYASQYAANIGASRALVSDPPAVQTTQGTCGTPNSGNSSPVFTAEVTCDSGLIGPPCPDIGLPGQRVESYPRQVPSQVIPAPLPANLPTMPNPCAGVPADPSDTFCP